jgi:hypothetical protein
MQMQQCNAMQERATANVQDATTPKNPLSSHARPISTQLAMENEPQATINHRSRGD